MFTIGGYERVFSVSRGIRTCLTLVSVQDVTPPWAKLMVKFAWPNVYITILWSPE